MEKIENTLKNIDIAIDKIKKNESKLVFLAQDTKGNPKASVAYIYKMAKVLSDEGHDVSILHEKNDYTMPGSWLGSDYDNLNHTSIENNDLKVGPHDIIVVPELYGHVFEQIIALPVEKIILIQNFDHLLDAFPPGKSWLDFDVSEAITTTKSVSEMIEDITPGKKIHYISPVISEVFKPNEKPQSPIVAIHCRDQRKAAKIIKTFYLKYPLYRFISFKDMHGMTEEDFANNLRDCAVSVWVDDDSTFGTFPVESILSNVPVIGKVPNLIPEWMTDDNGIWVYDENQIPDLIFNYMKNWLEDTLPENLLQVNNSITQDYTHETFKKTTIELFKNFMDNKVEKLNKIKESLLTTEKENEK